MKILHFTIISLCFVQSYKVGSRTVIDKIDENVKFELISFDKCIIKGGTTWGSSYGSGGAIFCKDKNININIINCIFTCCSASYQGGAIWLYNLNIVELYKCKIEECTSNSGSGGGVLLYTFQAPSESSNKYCISGCSFNKCNSTNLYGGGIFIWSPPAEFKMQNTIFISCHAGGWGGGIYFRITGNININQKQFYYCYFDNNTCGAKGMDVNIYDKDVNILKGNPFHYSFSSSSDNKKLYFERTDGKEDWRGDWLPFGTLNRCVVSGKSHLTEGCGDSEENACKNINVCIPTEGSGLWYIKMLDNVTEESSNIIGKDIFVKVSGKTKEYTLTNNLKYTSLFKVSGSLLVTRTIIATKDKSLFNVLSSGCVELTNLIVICLLLYNYLNLNKINSNKIRIIKLFSF